MCVCVCVCGGGRRECVNSTVTFAMLVYEECMYAALTLRLQPIIMQFGEPPPRRVLIRDTVGGVFQPFLVQMLCAREGGMWRKTD
jgi:hypothetical protein